MGILDRHKKPGGFRKLVNSIEVTPPEKRNMILDTMLAEDPIFISDVLRCVFKFEEFDQINDMAICELLYHFKEFKTLAVALHKAPEPLVNKFKKNMAAPQAIQFREEVSMVSQIKVSEQLGARYKIIELARALQVEGKFILKPYDSKYPD